MKQHVLTAFIGLLLSTVAPHVGAQVVFGPGPEAPANQLDAIVAVVDDDVITRSELKAALRAAERQLQQGGAALPAPDVLEKQVLERLILKKLQLRSAEREGVVIDDATLNAAIDSIAQQNNMNLDQMRETIERDGFSFAKFREQIREEIVIARLRQRVTDSRVQISETEVNDMLSNPAMLATANREYHLAQIFVAVPEKASPAQIQQAQEKIQRLADQVRKGEDFSRLAMSASEGREALEGGDLGWRSPDRIPALFVEVVQRLQPGQISDPIRSPQGFHLLKLLEVRDSGAQGIVETRARHILIKTGLRTSDDEARQRLVRLRERIINGEDFGQLAGANSDDAPSAVRGGELGWIKPGQTAPQFEAELNKLGTGQISEPFQTPFGWHIVQVEERRQGSGGSGDLQRTQARQTLYQRQAEEEWEQWLRSLREEAYVDIRL